MSIFSEALDVLAGRWKAVVVACFLPLIGASLIETIPVEDETLFSIPLILIQVCLYTCVAVAVHRIVLIGPDAVPRFGVILHVSRRELRFAGMVLLFIGLIFVVLFLSKAFFPFAMIALAALFYCVPVFSIVFPAVAVDSDLTLRELLGVGRGHYWLLAKATLVVPLVVGVFMNALGKAGTEVFGDVSPITSGITEHVVGALVLVIEIAVLSVAYGEIERRESPAAVFGS